MRFPEKKPGQTRWPGFFNRKEFKEFKEIKEIKES